MNRRRAVEAIGTTGIAGVAGCLGPSTTTDGRDVTDLAGRTVTVPDDVSRLVAAGAGYLVISFVGIIDFVGLVVPHIVRKVIGGDERFLLPASCLAGGVLLLDEPTSSLDVRHQLEVLDVVREEVDDGRAAVVAIHDLNLAARYCDRLAMLHDDRIVAAGGPDILTPETIRDVNGVEATVTTHEGRRIVIPEQPLSKDENS